MELVAQRALVRSVRFGEGIGRFLRMVDVVIEKVLLGEVDA